MVFFSEKQKVLTVIAFIFLFVLTLYPSAEATSLFPDESYGDVNNLLGPSNTSLRNIAESNQESPSPIVLNFTMSGLDISSNGCTSGHIGSIPEVPVFGGILFFGFQVRCFGHE